MSKHTIVCAGIDTGKRKLDVAIDECQDRHTVENDSAGHAALSSWLRQRRVGHVGIEASGGYEAEVVRQLRGDGFVVIVFQPAQVRAYASFHLRLAKNDKIDAALIAACTTASKKIHAAPDPRLAPLASDLTLIEQLTEDIAQAKTRREGCHGNARLRQFWSEEIRRLKRLERDELKRLVAAIRQHHDLAERFELINSVEGVGLRTAVVVLVRMPEIGRLSRAQAAALVGLAPYDNDSGERRGRRHIAGGRKRVRRALYAAAFAASFHWNAQLKVLYQRLTAAGKEHREALVACARKLLIFINTVVERGTPWRPSTNPRPI